MPSIKKLKKAIKKGKSVTKALKEGGYRRTSNGKMKR